MQSLYPLSEVFGLADTPLLSEISPKDYKLSALKRRALLTANMFRIASLWHPHLEHRHTFDYWSFKIRNCSTQLKFRLTDDGLKLHQSDFCRVRLCPFCASRKSNVWLAKGFLAFSQLSSYRFLFLTLTVPNCPVGQLRTVASNLSQSFLLFRKSLQYHLQDSYKGYLRSFECTRPNPYEAHPHYHVIIAVDDTYFSKYYLPFKQWCKLWANASKGEGFGIRVNAVRFDSTPHATKRLFLELLKYEIKPEDFQEDWKWLATYAIQVRGLQKFSSSGVFRDSFKFLEKVSDADLIHAADKFNWSLGNRYCNYVWSDTVNQYLMRGA